MGSRTPWIRGFLGKILIVLISCLPFFFSAVMKVTTRQIYSINASVEANVMETSVNATETLDFVEALIQNVRMKMTRYASVDPSARISTRILMIMLLFGLRICTRRVEQLVSLAPKSLEGKILFGGTYSNSDYYSGDIICELAGEIKTQNVNGREVYKGLVENGLGRYRYQLFADTNTVVYLECDRDTVAPEINHSCSPNAKFQEVSNGGICN